MDTRLEKCENVDEGKGWGRATPFATSYMIGREEKKERTTEQCGPPP